MFPFHLPLSLGFLFQALMLVHFFRRRPEGYWFFVILFLGPLGALIYFVVEVIPDLRIKPPAIQAFERRRRRQWLEQVAGDSPSLENLQELGEIHAAEGQHERAIDYFSQVIKRDAEAREALYGRAQSRIKLGDFAGAAADLEPVVRAEPAYHFYEAYLTLAECYEKLGQDEAALRVYQEILGHTTISRAYYNYGQLLARRGDMASAREMMQQILAKQPALPRYLRRQERPWFHKAEAFLKANGKSSEK